MLWLLYMSSAWCAQKVHDSRTDTHQTWSSSSWPIQNLTTTREINYSTTEAHISSQTPDTKGNPLADINAKIDAPQENYSPNHLHTSPWSPSFRDRNYLKNLLDNCWHLGLKNLPETSWIFYLLKWGLQTPWPLISPYPCPNMSA